MYEEVWKIWAKIHTIAFHVYFYLNVYHAVRRGTGAECKNGTSCDVIHKNAYHTLKNVYHTPIFIKIPIYIWICSCYINLRWTNSSKNPWYVFDTFPRKKAK